MRRRVPSAGHDWRFIGLAALAFACGAAVLLPGYSLQDATDVLERLRAATPHGSSTSVGVAERASGETASDVLARADAALYEAKDTGRDCLRAA